MSEEKQQVNVTKFTLSTGKEIFLREPKISDTEHATKIAGMEAGPENTAYLGTLFQKEMVKLLLVAVDGKQLSLKEKMSMDSLFNMKEYGQVSRCMKVVLGDDDGGKFELTPEIVTL
jgi:hypothetical protein